jgi:hypothetical protein
MYISFFPQFFKDTINTENGLCWPFTIEIALLKIGKKSILVKKETWKGRNQSFSVCLFSVSVEMKGKF